MTRGEIWWADLPDPRGSEPGFRRPVLIIQSDSFNRSRIQTILAAVISGNLRLSEAPGNVFLPSRSTGLPRDSVANVSQLVTIDRAYLSEHAGTLSEQMQTQVDSGLRLILDL